MQETTEQRVKAAPNGHAGGFLAGMFIGGLAAAGTVLLLAPQPGERTRAEVRRKGLELRQQAAASLGSRFAETRAKANDMAAAARGRLAELRLRGRQVIENRPELAPAAIAELPAV